MKRFEKAKEIIQSDQFGNVIDFFTGMRTQDSPTTQTPPKKQTPPTPDYTPIIILGAVAVLVALIRR